MRRSVRTIAWSAAAGSWWRRQEAAYSVARQFYSGPGGPRRSFGVDAGPVATRSLMRLAMIGWVTVTIRLSVIR